MVFLVGTITNIVASEAEEIAEHRANRGIVNLDNTFVPKGQWIVGLTASYSTHNNDDYQILLVEGIESMGYTVTASPILAYAFNNNLAAGGRFVYGRSLLKIDQASLSVAGTDLSLQDYYSITDSYTGMAIMRAYLPFGKQKRLAFFTEIQLEGGLSRSMMAYDSPVIGTYAKGYHLGVGVVPGIVAFATNAIALEVTVGVLGVNYSHTDQVGNQVYLGEVDNTNLNLNINLLSIGFGVSFYL